MSPQEKIKKLKKLQDVLILKDEKSILLAEKLDSIKLALEGVVSEMERATKDFVNAVPKINEPVIVDQTSKLQEILQEVKKKDIIDLSISPELRLKLKGDKGEPGQSIIGPKGEKGDQGIPGIPGDIKDLSPQEIRDELELLQGDERLDKSAIKGLDEEFKRIEMIKTSVSSGGGGGAGIKGMTKFHDLSASTNGVTKVFTVPKSRSAIVIGSDFPTILMENNGFTLNASRTQLTLTTDNAPSSGSQLLYQYVSVFN